ncbi:MAG TPA: hypothetical protein VF691_16440 [Cytophagaceae bacterium]|jgi:hypothetical protein
MKYLPILLLLSSYSFAQDVIVKRDDSRLDAKVVEIGPSTITYKKFNSTDGKEFKISKNDVTEIQYQNGEVEQVTAPSVRSSYTTDFGKHFISYNTMSLLFSNISFAYEYYFSTGHFGIKVPLTLGFGNTDFDPLGNDNNIYSIGLNKVYSAGVDFNFYPGGQGRFRYFLGTGLEFGQFNYYRSYYNPNSQTNYGSDTKTREIGTYFAIPFKNGLHIQPTKNFNIQLSTGIGLGRSNANYGTYYSYQDTEEDYLLYWNTSLNLGVRF